MDAPLPAAVAHTVLVSSTGHRFDITQLLGTTVVISDMMTLCQETCPLDTADIVAAARAAAKAGVGRKITFLSITIDPARDTRTRLAAYRAMYRPAPKDWVLATAAPAALRRFWAALGTYVHRVSNQPPAPRDWLTHKPLTYDLTHSDEVYFVDSQGHERFLLEGAPHVTGNAPIPDRLRRFMDAIGRKNLRHSHPAAWTLPQELQVLSWLSGLNIGT
ncbi:MAG TPA: SCO family protein [Mycobacterium sp.]|nr:SCO family protein [Mycobacterium sp.]